jgi:8-oxo-dGTP pyrophosphatase MutT (NUDIX family)
MTTQLNAPPAGTGVLHHPPLAADLDMIRAYFAAVGQGAQQPELRNPHVEEPVPASVRSQAKVSAVLLPIINRPQGPTLLVTRRHARIRFAGHICFPGGRVDEVDTSPVETALRETREEINLATADIEVLGVLGDYYTQAGYRITPVVGLVQPPFEVLANPDEVDEIYEVSLARALDGQNYALTWHRPGRAHFSFSEDNVRIAGPTVSVLIGFYEALLGFESSRSAALARARGNI